MEERKSRAGVHSIPTPQPQFWDPSPSFGQPHPGIVAGGVGPLGAAGFSQGDDFAGEVADLLEGGVGEFPAVGDDGPGSREQGEDELAACFSLLKKKNSGIAASFCQGGV